MDSYSQCGTGLINAIFERIILGGVCLTCKSLHAYLRYYNYLNLSSSIYGAANPEIFSYFHQICTFYISSIIAQHFFQKVMELNVD